MRSHAGHVIIHLPMTGYSIGVDLGGTNLRAAAIDSTGKMLEKIAGSTNFSEGRDAVLADIVKAMSALREHHGTKELAGIGIEIGRASCRERVW